MVENDQRNEEAQAAAYEVRQQLQTAIARAVETITGDNNANPLEVFPNPTEKERREDVEFDTQLTEEQETRFRAAMAELGLGRLENRDAEAVGLQEGHTALLEGGQGHKMKAELNLALTSKVKPSMVILSGDSGREIPESESILTARVLGIDADEVGQTELAVAEQVLRNQPGFIEEEPSVLPISYTQDGEVGDEPSGQFVRVGRFDTTPAVVMRIDRDYEGEGDGRTFKRPDNFTKMSIVSQIDDVEEIGFFTSSTYQPSVELDAVRATVATDTVVKVPTYGMAELAQVKGEPVAQPPALRQLAGEAYKTAQQLQKLS